jgi:tellurite resistance protein TerC
MDVGIWPWVAFNLFVLFLLVLDLGVFNRKAHVVSAKEAGMWTAVWVSLAAAFCTLLYFWKGATPALDFATGYLIEYSLSVDNIFVFVLLFSAFRVPAEYQHRVLFWGILGAIIMRGTFIGLGTALLNRFHWIIYIFGAFLIYSGIKMALHKDEEMHPEENRIVGFFRRFVPMTHAYQGARFFVRENGKRLATPLLLVLVIVETTDVIFAVDSIPAIFAITTDPFIVYTSNLFAVLGLRSLYFLLAHVVDKFHYLKIALSIILTFVGVKMLIGAIGYKVNTLASLGVIVGTLTIAILASIVRAKKLEQEPHAVDPTTLHEPQEPPM